MSMTWNPPSPEESGPNEVYTVEIHRNPRTGVAQIEKWLKGGQVHRVDGPALIVRDRETGAVTQELWMRNGELHREDGPASLTRDLLTGRIKYSTWHINGRKVPAPSRSRRDAEVFVRRGPAATGPRW